MVEELLQAGPVEGHLHNLEGRLPARLLCRGGFAVDLAEAFAEAFGAALAITGWADHYQTQVG